jgi:hypothetical protein
MHIILIITVSYLFEGLSKLSKQMAQEGGVGDDGDALFGAGVEPFQKLDGPGTTIVVGFAFVRVKQVFVVDHFGKVKVGKLPINFGNIPATITDIMPHSLTTLFPHQHARPWNVNARLVLRRTHGCRHGIQKGGRSRLSRLPKNVQCRFTRPCQWRHHHQIKRREGPSSRWPLGQNFFQCLRLLNTMGRKPFSRSKNTRSKNKDEK